MYIYNYIYYNIMYYIYIYMSETKEVSFFVTISPCYNVCSKKTP